MLLPSALSCGYTTTQPAPTRQSRPKLPSFERYDPFQRSQSPVYGLIATCRALQNMIGDRFASSATPSPSLDATLRAKPLASPFGEPTPPPTQLPAPRGCNKRRRNSFDENTQESYRNDHARAKDCHFPYDTPKRRRIVPVDIPPGLQSSDFEALAEVETPVIRTPAPTYPSPRVDLPADVNMSPISEPQPSVGAWTEDDDRLLVQTVLSKLRLSTKDWNDCARRLGKDKDSLDHRWQLLLGKGNVGLRRGIGNMDRMELDIESWQ